jgi:hypothetical protein
MHAYATKHNSMSRHSRLWPTGCECLCLFAGWGTATDAVRVTADTRGNEYSVTGRHEPLQGVAIILPKCKGTVLSLKESVQATGEMPPQVCACAALPGVNMSCVGLSHKCFSCTTCSGCIDGQVTFSARGGCMGCMGTPGSGDTARQIIRSVRACNHDR